MKDIFDEDKKLIRKLKEDIVSSAIDIYKDFDETEIKSQPQSIQMLWKGVRTLLNVLYDRDFLDLCGWRHDKA